MDTWYYTEGERRRSGPVSLAQLAALCHDRQLTPQTLVQRDGSDSWQPLGDILAHVGPDTLSVDGHSPPPLPRRAIAHAGLSSLALAGIVAGVLGITVLLMAATFACVAVPAYREHRLRAQVSEAVWALSALQSRVATHRTTEGRCPGRDDDPLVDDALADLDHTGIDGVHLADLGDDGCGIEARLSTPDDDELDGKTLLLTMDTPSGRWHCRSEIDDRLLPSYCRG